MAGGEKPVPTPVEFEAAMRQHFAAGYDPDAAHSNADRDIVELLRRLGYGAGADVFDRAMKWYS